MIPLKPDIHVVKKGTLYYLATDRNKIQRFKPWLCDSFSFLYDVIMERSVFPKKFGADVKQHYQTLSQELADVRGKNILELGTGSGSAVNFLDHDNRYTGTDVSPGLLKQAAKRFTKAGFLNPEFYVVSADDLPFSSEIYDLCLCILSLNFIGNAKKVFQEVNRILLPNGIFVCVVPVPEKNILKSTIRGVLYSETELSHICNEHGFQYYPISCDNGALLYFKAIKQ